MVTMKAGDLQHGQLFKVLGQRKFRTVNKIVELVNHDHIPPLGRKILIIHDGCSQMTIPKGFEVLTKECNRCDGIGQDIEYHQPAGKCESCQGTGVETIKD